jgi:hypothetical protein
MLVMMLQDPAEQEKVGKSQFQSLVIAWYCSINYVVFKLGMVFTTIGQTRLESSFIPAKYLSTNVSKATTVIISMIPRTSTDANPSTRAIGWMNPPFDLPWLI